VQHLNNRNTRVPKYTSRTLSLTHYQLYPNNKPEPQVKKWGVNQRLPYRLIKSTPVGYILMGKLAVSRNSTCAELSTELVDWKPPNIHNAEPSLTQLFWFYKSAWNINRCLDFHQTRVGCTSFGRLYLTPPNFTTWSHARGTTGCKTAHLWTYSNKVHIL
jgi:hypothetical protein